MLMFILNNNFERVGMFDTDDYNPERFNLNTDLQTYSISDGVLLSTFTASFSKRYELSQYLVVGNYIAFQDEWDKMWCFLINEITNEDDETREIYCEDLGLDLLNSASLAYSVDKPQSIEYYVKREIYDSGWTIGINEIETHKKVELDASTTALRRLQDIATAFDCEMYFTIDFAGNELSKQEINIVKRIGVEIPQVRLQANKEITEIQKTVDIKELRTAVYAKGANGVDIANFSYNDGRFISNYGSNLIYDSEAASQWNRFPNIIGGSRGYLEMVNESESSEPAQILADAITALKQCNEPKVTYEASFTFDVGHDVSIGDKVQLVDLTFNPKLLLEARINTIEVSRLDTNSNKVTISNAKEVPDGISQALKDIQSAGNRIDKVENESINISIVQKAEGDKRQLIAQVWRGNVNITDEFSDNEFVWTKTDISGKHDELWEKRHQCVGPIITEDLNSVDRTAVYECSVLYHQFQLVSVQWFQTALKDLTAKIIAEKGENDIAVIFATDVHQALGTTIRANYVPLQFAREHIKNIVELSNMAPIDLIVLGGDNADGSTSKNQQVEAIKNIMLILQQSNIPYAVAKGNHDDNSWYAETKSKDSWDLCNVIDDKEMYQLIAKPSLKFKGMDVRNCYYCIDIKRTRHIVLNSHEIPYVLNDNGNPKYSGQRTAAYTNEQIKWLIDKLKTAGDKHICLYQHIEFKGGYNNMNTSSNDLAVYNDDVIMGILNAYQNRKRYNCNRNNSDFPVNVNVDFEKAKGCIVYGMFGHYHNDRIKTVNDIRFVSTGACAPIARKINGNGPLDNREIHTVKEDLFDAVIIKPNERKVKCLRFGAGNDREFNY